MPRLALLIGLAPLLLACSPANTSPPPSTPSSQLGAPAAPAPGTRVMILRNNQWLPGTVVRQDQGGRVLVHYEGFGPEWDEVVGPERLRPQQDAPSTDAAAARDYRPGDKVLVRVQNRLLLADVVQQVSASSWRVHYDGYGPEVGETVGPDRLRRPHAGTSARPVGQPVGVDVGAGRVMPGKIVALVAADRWVVRFDGFGPEYDQEVGTDKVRDAPKPGDAAATPAAATASLPAAAGTEDKTKGGKDKAGKDKADAKAKPAEPPPVAVPTGPLQVGESVVVAHRNTFHAATVAALGPGGTVRVRYESTATGAAEEEMPADRVIRLPAQLKGTKYAANQKVFIEWHGMYVPGKVLKEGDKGQYKVRFDGFGPEADEVVQTKRLRPRP